MVIISGNLSQVLLVHYVICEKKYGEFFICAEKNEKQRIGNYKLLN